MPRKDAISDANITCCGGSSADFVKVLDKNRGRKAGVQNPCTLNPLPFERLLHKPSFSVMGRIDMCSMLRTFLLWLNGLSDERWVQSTQYLEGYVLVITFCCCNGSIIPE